MASTSGSASGHSWSDLMSELLGLVLSRLPSHADRVRIAAVCRPWLSNARLLRPLPPLLPWLALRDGTFLSLPDGAVHRVPVADDIARRVSTGSMLFLLHGDDTCSLMNPSPARTTPLPELAGYLRERPYIRKVVVSVAALVNVRKSRYSTTTKVVISTRGQPWDITRSSTTEWQEPGDCYANDIALFQGKLYILTMEVEHNQQELYVLDDGQEQMAIRSIPGVDRDSIDNYMQRNYLVVSGERLLMVERGINLPPLFPRDSGIVKRTRHFKVFEAADLSSGHGRWIEVNTLMGRAIFLSEGCSESLPAMGQCGDVGVREDCIYFINENDYPMLDSGVYNLRDKRVMPLLLETMATPAASKGPWYLTWLFPET